MYASQVINNMIGALFLSERSAQSDTDFSLRQRDLTDADLRQADDIQVSKLLPWS